MRVKSESEVAQSCPGEPMDCSPPGSSVHGIFRARVLEWGPLPSPVETASMAKDEKGLLTEECKCSVLEQTGVYIQINIGVLVR